MTNEDKILLRRQILDWRDKHIENIDHHLNREIIFLFNELEQKIQKMSIKDIFKSDAYTKRLQPIYCNGQVKQDTLLSRLFIKFPLILNRGLIA